MVTSGTNPKPKQVVNVTQKNYTNSKDTNNSSKPNNFSDSKLNSSNKNECKYICLSVKY